MDLMSTSCLPFRFLFDKSSLEYLYFRNRVAVLKKAQNIKSEDTSDDGEIATPLVFPLRKTKIGLQNVLTICQFSNVSHIFLSRIM